MTASPQVSTLQPTVALLNRYGVMPRGWSPNQAAAEPLGRPQLPGSAWPTESPIGTRCG